MNYLWLPLFILLWLAAVFFLYRRHRRHASETACGLWCDVLAAGLLWLLVAGFFWRTLSGDVFQPADGGDLVSFLFPTYRFAAAELSRGSLPLWNPTLYAGAPFIGDIQAGFLYLPNLILFLAMPDFPYAALQWLAVLHLYWAGLGVYVLLRTLRWSGQPVSRVAALFGAVAFTFCDPLLIHLGNLNLIAVLSWLPWIVAAYAVAVESGRLRAIAVTALLFALSTYAGHAQSTLYTGLALVIYTAGQMAAPAAAGQSWGRRLGQPVGVLAATVALTVLLAAPVLLPAAEMTRHTVRSDFTYQDTVAYSLAPTQLLAGLVTPGFFGRGPALHWSLWERVELPYLGVPVLILAIAALLVASPELRRRLWPWVGMALFGLIVALGIYGIVHGWLTVLLPLFDQFRAPARALILWALAASVLAAVGLDAIARQATRPAALTTLLRWGGMILSLAVLLAYLALLLTQADETAFLRASVAALALALAWISWLLAWALLAARLGRYLNGTAFGVLVLALLYFELAAAGAYTDISSADPTRGFQHQAIVEFLRNDPTLFRIDTRTDIDDLWQPDTAALAGLQDVGGVANPLLLRSFHHYWESTGGRASRAYDLLNVKYVLVREGTELPGDKFALAFGPVDGLEVYENRAFVPRAWVAPAGADLAALAPPATPGDATVTTYSSSAMSVQAVAPEGGYLVLSELWYPGWHATVNGAAAAIEQANGALRAVPLPPGASTVELRFWPASLTWGLIAAAAGLVLAAFAAFSPRRQRF